MMKIQLASVLLLALAAGACGGKSVSETSTTAPAPSLAATSTQTTAAPLACRPSEILPVLEARLGPTVARVDVVRCRHAYVRVNALPDLSGCPPNCYETQEAYLHWVSGRWKMIDFGTGIECEDTTTIPPLPAPIRRACRALGYPQPRITSGETFQMPSRNIGCKLSQAGLRCDIRSGLEPTPQRPCALAWVGLVLPPKGPARPNCAGGTVYDAGAPTLAYGELWHGGSFWCESRESGLLCSNPQSDRGSFLLSRAEWEGG